MPIPEGFPKSPHDELLPGVRWTPDRGDQLLEKQIPPLVRHLREKVKKWRDDDYAGASNTSRALLNWWFNTEHILNAESFQYYYAQREAVETVIFLYDADRARHPTDLLQYDDSGLLTESRFDEDWLRLVIKMATGSGKTKVISLLMAWSFFHKKYEKNSTLARNFLLIAPNIIVLDRLRTDFEGLKIFLEDPVLPDNGYEGQNWRDDFQLRFRLQDDTTAIRETGNLFLTNIQRIYSSKENIPSVKDDNTKDYYLGGKPVTKTRDSKVNIADIVRDVKELVVFNDEAHHIHKKDLAWFKSIGDISNSMKRRNCALSLQVDVSATPKHENGGIFVQTISDYPLVEAIFQKVVKHPVIPDEESRAKLKETPSTEYDKRYRDHIDLGCTEWKKLYDEYINTDKKPVLFVMTDVTDSCDEVADYLRTQPGLRGKDAVLTIHTNQHGDISEKPGKKNEKELKKLREAANQIDNDNSPYKAIVSVLMLKEGWDVKNVTTIVGLRSYQAQSNILPEQTLGRGLRRMFARTDNESEKVSVIGTDAFMDFVKKIEEEGVELERAAMGPTTKPQGGLVIEVDRKNSKKDIDALDMSIPILTPRLFRDYEKLEQLDASRMGNKKLIVREFDEEEMRKFVFYYIVGGEKAHETKMGGAPLLTYREILGFYVKDIMRELRLFSGYDVLFGKMKEFAASYLFERKVDLEDPNIARNLSDKSAQKEITEAFINAINELILSDRGVPAISGQIRLSDSRTFVAKPQEYIIPAKSVFNKIIGDSHLELEFAAFLESCSDIISHTKNYFTVGFRIDYATTSGGISNYYPDFLVRVNEHEIYIVETKGREDKEDPGKLKRLRQWCQDVNEVQKDTFFGALYVTQEDFNQYRPRDFAEAIRLFKLT